MCNPNALVYQWMITATNAYWLDFFLRRDCNVFIWNYRGYGRSQQSIFTPCLTPDQQRRDAERVFQFLVNRIGVKGKIGAYGRSIGGIAASHLVSKFPDHIEVFVGDRTMGSFENIAITRAKSNIFQSQILTLYHIISNFWCVNNGEDIYKNKNCYKILTFDEEDDVVDLYASLHHQVAEVHSKTDYNQKEWKQFYQSLSLLFDLEDRLMA